MKNILPCYYDYIISYCYHKTNKLSSLLCDTFILNKIKQKRLNKKDYQTQHITRSDGIKFPGIK